MSDSPAPLDPNLPQHYEPAQIGEVERLRTALDESVALQSHYAKILNMYDGGERIVFKSTAQWIDRLRTIGKLKS